MDARRPRPPARARARDATRGARRYCETLGKAECRARLEAHWDTWVTEDAIADLAAAGITHVRVPVGHWIACDVADDEPYVCGVER